MPTDSVRRAAPFLLVAAALCFALLGVLLIPLAGIQNDEALFANTLFLPAFAPYTLAILHHHLPLMVFPYTGAFKTYLYWPVFRVFSSNAYSLRFPMVLAGVLTIVLFYLFTKRIAGIYAAIVAALLLATDPSFLLANTFDWGPVALQHLLLVAGCFLIARGNLRSGFFVFGLGLWDKSVFVWPLAGLAAGVVAAYFPEVRHALRDRRKIAQAALAFLIGASPLIVYNIQSDSQTVRSTAHFSLEHLPHKVRELNRALNGSGLFGFIAAQEWEGDPKPSVSTEARIATRIHDRAGDRYSNLLPFAVLIAALAAPFWWRSQARKPALFAIVFSVITFGFMAVTRDAGEAVHHTILLWPMPHLLVAAALAALPQPRWQMALASVLVLTNLLVINQYFFQFDRYGAHGDFTDAVYPLAEDLRAAATNPGAHIYVMDWGLTETLTFLDRGKLPLFVASDPFFAPAPDPQQQAFISKIFDDPQGLFAGHVRSREVFHWSRRAFRRRRQAGRLSEGDRARDLRFEQPSRLRNLPRAKGLALTDWKRPGIPLWIAALFAFLWAVARACVQSITMDEAGTYLTFVGRTEPFHWFPAANNHVLNSALMRLFTSVFGLSHLTVRLPALLGAAIYIGGCVFICTWIHRSIGVRLLLFICLVYNPFVFDFLVAARGYGLASAFLLWAVAMPAGSVAQRLLPSGFARHVPSS